MHFTWQYEHSCNSDPTRVLRAASATSRSSSGLDFQLVTPTSHARCASRALEHKIHVLYKDLQGLFAIEVRVDFISITVKERNPTIYKNTTLHAPIGSLNTLSQSWAVLQRTYFFRSSQLTMSALYGR